MSEREPWDKYPWEERDPPLPWGETLRAFNYPECGDTPVTVDMLYQAFKARLLVELVAKPADAMFNPDSGHYETHFPLIERK